jgi:hypothetical protein
MPDSDNFMKPRRIYIIPAGSEISESIIAAAKQADCPEIAVGIPPRLKGIVDDKDLPCSYEEPMPAQPISQPDLISQLADIKQRLANIEKNMRIIA